MYNGLLHAHSGLRWLVLASIIIAIVNALVKSGSGKAYTAADKRWGLIAMMTSHIQFVIGLVLYFISPKVSFADGWMKNTLTRFFGMEHLVMMLIAIIVITIGYSKAKRQTDSAAKFKTTWIFFLIGLIIMLAGIPWPFRGLGAGWF